MILFEEATKISLYYFCGRLGVEENVSFLERERWLRDIYHTFAQVPLLVQVLNQVWEKSHRQMGQTSSRWSGSNRCLCSSRCSARFGRNPIGRWVRQVADGPCDCIGTSTRSGCQPSMGVPHRQMRRTGNRWSCTFTRSSSQLGMGVTHRQMRRTCSRWLCTFTHSGS